MRVGIYVQAHVYMCMYRNICTYIHLIHIQSIIWYICCSFGKNVPIVPPFTVREGSFTDYIAEEMHRKFIKERKIWGCFSVAMFRRLPCSTNKFRWIQSCDILHLQNSACLCNYFRLVVNIPNKPFLILILTIGRIGLIPASAGIITVTS